MQPMIGSSPIPLEDGSVLRSLVSDRERHVAALTTNRERARLLQWNLDESPRPTSTVDLGPCEPGAAVALVGSARILAIGLTSPSEVSHGGVVRDLSLPVLPHRIASAPPFDGVAIAHGADVARMDVESSSVVTAYERAHDDSIRSLSLASTGHCVATDYDGRTVLWSPTGAVIGRDDSGGEWSALDPNDPATVYVVSADGARALAVRPGLPLEAAFSTPGATCTALLVNDTQELVLAAVVFPGRAASALWLFDRRSGERLRQIPLDVRVTHLVRAGNHVVGGGTPGGLHAMSAADLFRRPKDTRVVRRSRR
jgi:hypothetical protein